VVSQRAELVGIRSQLRGHDAAHHEEHMEHFVTDQKVPRQDETDEMFGRRRHGKVNCNLNCCPKVPGPAGGRSTADSLMRLNAHCNFTGHCVQLKHTFIHVECSSTPADEDDCVLCKLSKPRARSHDNLDRHSSPATAPGSPPTVTAARTRDEGAQTRNKIRHWPHPVPFTDMPIAASDSGRPQGLRLTAPKAAASSSVPWDFEDQEL